MEERKEKATLAEKEILGAYLIVGSPSFCSLDDGERLLVETYKNRNPTWLAESDFPIAFTLFPEAVPLGAEGIERLIMTVLNSDFARKFGRCSVFIQPFAASKYKDVEKKEVQACLLTFSTCPPMEKNKIFIVQGEIEFRK